MEQVVSGIPISVGFSDGESCCDKDTVKIKKAYLPTVAYI